MVVGLSAAALQGAPVVTEDVDLWFENLNDPCFNRALKAVGAAYVPPFALNPLHRLADDRQPYACSLIKLRPVQPLEHSEHPLLCFRGQPDSVVFEPDAHERLIGIRPRFSSRLM